MAASPMMVWMVVPRMHLRVCLHCVPARIRERNNCRRGGRDEKEHGGHIPRLHPNGKVLSLDSMPITTEEAT
jgi:hypothetical protein